MMNETRNKSPSNKLNQISKSHICGKKSNNEDWDDFEKSIEDKKKYSYENELCNIILDCEIFNDESDDKTLDYYIKEYDKKDHKYKIQKKKIQYLKKKIII